MELAALVNQAKSLLDGVDPLVMKKTAETRAALAEGFTALESELSTLIVDAPKRAFDFSDD